eukprot:CAMPEP_0179938458 /NCGR_PEP_ID=MMETSP0983-20121128/14967_1 /TAXON_ID=483367 /ORGANISM="non described non described, Strain CCMP 2436" /LENGTH=156 /DNA_ID=CAMNT_0021844441 /DNA_START=430 /DNA_END=898 /DNA_ORIENTATION=-
MAWTGDRRAAPHPADWSRNERLEDPPPPPRLLAVGCCGRYATEDREAHEAARARARHEQGREGAHRGPAAAFGAASAARPARTCGPRPSRAETTRSAPALSPVVHAAVPVRRSVVADALYTGVNRRARRPARRRARLAAHVSAGGAGFARRGAIRR